MTKNTIQMVPCNHSLDVDILGSVIVLILIDLNRIIKIVCPQVVYLINRPRNLFQRPNGMGISAYLCGF